MQDAQFIFSVTERAAKLFQRDLNHSYKIAKHNVNFVFVSFLGRKAQIVFLKKAEIWHYYAENKTKICSKYGIALLTA